MANEKYCWLCDPEKNVDCKKDLCQTECFYTTCPRYAKDGAEALPVEDNSVWFK